MYKNFEDMLKRLSPRLRGIAHRLNGRFTFFNDDDLFQEALAHLWVTFANGSLSGKTDSYILQGCYFYLKNYIRTAVDKAAFTSFNEFSENDDTSLENLIPDNSQNIAKDVDERLLRESAGENMDAREREVLELSYDGLTVREIGKRLNISHVMVVKIRSRLKSKIRLLRNNIGYQN
ncbi:MAG: sigma-70 family RNA polymerase sigma factor [Candidatus Omnitrophica bacterium]|nr:sigma-70 family RNA polymerase sigma factor [Candidatus Omnitrophota bacterium]